MKEMDNKGHSVAINNTKDGRYSGSLTCLTEMVTRGLRLRAAPLLENRFY